jgi:hypothetical protein
MLEDTRRLMIGGVVVMVALVVIGGFLLFRGSPESKVTVTSIPSDLTLTLDGKQVAANGEIKVKAGEHTLMGERKGFQSHSVTFKAQDGDPLSARMYLYSNSDEGRAWEAKNPEQELEAEAEAGRRFDELNQRLAAKYPLLAELPYVGRGFTINQGVSKAHPKDPENLAFYIKLLYPDGRKYALEWLSGHGYKPETLELIYTQ